MFERRGYRLRSLRLAVILVLGFTLVTASSASAVEPFTVPAGLGCSFDVLVQPVHKEVGDHFPIGFGNITMTNVDTGVSYVQKSRYTKTETFDSQTNTVDVAVNGRIWIEFYPGDQGPGGVVGEPGAMLAFAGAVQLTYDIETDVYTAFSNQGNVTDLCALLAQ